MNVAKIVEVHTGFGGGALTRLCTSIPPRIGPCSVELVLSSVTISSSGYSDSQFSPAGFGPDQNQAFRLNEKTRDDI